MKGIPILFSTEMVKSLLAGRKTMTRRILKIDGCKPFVSYPDEWDINEIMRWNKNYHPFGQPGDILWVRETFYAYGHWIQIEKKGKPAMEFVDETIFRGLKHRYFDNPPEKVQKKRLYGTCAWYKRPSLFMPGATCRIFLKVKSVRVERLQDITQQDAISEGIQSWPLPDKNEITVYKDYLIDWNDFERPDYSFRSLWKLINGLDSWDENPWVWVIEFEREEKP